MAGLTTWLHCWCIVWPCTFLIYDTHEMIIIWFLCSQYHDNEPQRYEHCTIDIIAAHLKNSKIWVTSEQIYQPPSNTYTLKVFLYSLQSEIMLNGFMSPVILHIKFPYIYLAFDYVIVFPYQHFPLKFMPY